MAQCRSFFPYQWCRVLQLGSQNFFFPFCKCQQFHLIGNYYFCPTINDIWSEYLNQFKTRYYFLIFFFSYYVSFLFFIYYLFWFVLETSSRRPGCPLNQRDLSTSVSLVQGLKTCASTALQQWVLITLIPYPPPPVFTPNPHLVFLSQIHHFWFTAWEDLLFP